MEKMHNNSYCTHSHKTEAREGRFILYPTHTSCPLIWPTLTPAPTFGHKTQNPYGYMNVIYLSSIPYITIL